MAGPAAFQANAFQPDAFQAVVTYALTASPYSLGALAFATPALTVKRVLAASPYTLGSPSFAAPPLAGRHELAANTYALGSPTYATPPLDSEIIEIGLAANPYWLGAPVYAAPGLGLTVRLSAAAYTLAPLAFAAPALTITAQLIAPTYSLLAPLFDKPALILGTINIPLAAAPYSLGPPTSTPPPLTSWDPNEEELPIITTSTITIPAGARVSNSLDARNARIVHFSVPPQWDPKANLSFLCSIDDVEFMDLMNEAGRELLIGARPDTRVIVPTTWPLGYAFIRFRSGQKIVDDALQETDCIFSVTTVT
jgi:hypothetical protein